MEAFVYCWTDHKTSKLYVGSHKGSIDDSYICSSKPMLEQYLKRPEDFTRQIIAEGKYEDIRTLENKILESVNAALNEDYYNQHNGNGKFYILEHTDTTKQKLSVKLKGRTPWNKGKVGVYSENTLNRMRKPKSEEHKTQLKGPKNKTIAMSISKIGNTNRVGKFHTEESKIKMRQKLKGRIPWNKGLKNVAG